MGFNGAELDDLVQEGVINIWRCLCAGKTPSAEFAQKRMLQYVRWLGMHPGGLTGLGLDKDGYPEMLPLDSLIGTPDEPSED